MLNNRNQKLLTIGLDQKEVTDHHKYAYINQAEDPVFVSNNNDNNNNNNNNNRPQRDDLAIIKIDEGLVGQEPLLLYYNQHRLKVKKFFDKIKTSKQQVSAKELKVLQEV